MENEVRYINLPGFTLHVMAHPGKSVLALRFTGKINEDVTLTEVPVELRNLVGADFESVFIDLSGVNSINSVGVREWIMFLERIQAIYALQFTRIGEIFIELAAFSPTVLGKKATPVIECEIPYFCASCDIRKTSIITTDSLGMEAEKITKPIVKCEKCSSVMEFDGFEEEYFAFIEHSKA